MVENKNKNYEVASIGELSQQLYCNGRKQSDSCTYTQANAWYAHTNVHTITHTHSREKKKNVTRDGNEETSKRDCSTKASTHASHCEPRHTLTKALHNICCTL